MAKVFSVSGDRTEGVILVQNQKILLTEIKMLFPLSSKL